MFLMDWTIFPYKSIILSLLFICCNTLYAQTIPPPVISSFTPNTGAVGTQVTITGKNFSKVPTENIVYFGAVQAPVIKASASTLVVTVPAGASYQPVTVTTNRLTAYSNTFFSVTFPTDGSGITTNTFVKDTIHYEVHGGDLSSLNIAISDLTNDNTADIIVPTELGVQTF